MEANKDSICISVVYRDEAECIKKFINYHESIGVDQILIIDTTGTMGQKMITHQFSQDKVSFITHDGIDVDAVNKVVLPYCRKYCITWLLHLSISDRIDLNGNFRTIHQFLKPRHDCDGIVILKVKSCKCKGEARCITRVKYTNCLESTDQWRYNIRNPTIIRATTNEIYHNGIYDQFQKVLRDKYGKSEEIVQIIRCTDIKNGWIKYFKSFLTTEVKEDTHDTQCIDSADQQISL